MILEILVRRINLLGCHRDLRVLWDEEYLYEEVTEIHRM